MKITIHQPSFDAMVAARAAIESARLFISFRATLQPYEKAHLKELNEQVEAIDKAINAVTEMERGERAYFHRHRAGMWDSSNTGLKSGMVVVEDVNMKDGHPFWYDVKTDEENPTYYRVDACQLSRMRSQ